MKRPTAFVTGGTGFIGSHLIRKLLEQSYDVHILYRPTSPSPRLKDVLSLTTHHNIDICDKDELQKVLKEIQPDYIFHLANIGIYGGNESADEDVINVNFFGTVNLLKASKNIPYKLFVNTGSSSEYGPKTNSMKELDSCFPESTYGVSKLAATLYAKNFAEKNDKPIVTLRLFSPYGPDDDPRRFITTVISQSLNDKKITLTNSDNVRDFIYINDVIEAYMSCISTKKKLGGKIINIGSGSQHTIKDVLKIITDLTATKSKIATNKSKIKYESLVWQADITNAAELLNWHPTTSLKEGIEQTIEWIKSVLN